MSKQLIHGIHPDYWICAAGAQVLDRDGNPLHISTMTDQQMYALVDFLKITTTFSASILRTAPTPT